MRIGVLGLQGDFAAHVASLHACGFETRLVKRPEDLVNLDGLVLPGGESTVQLKLLVAQKLWQPLDELARVGLPIFATCAGSILAAEHALNPEQDSFGWVPITIERNGYGDQRHSFTTEAKFKGRSMQLVFIRAPRVISVDSPEVEVLLSVKGDPVLLRYKNFTLATFHPELTNDQTLYRYCFSSYATAAITARA